MSTSGQVDNDNNDPVCVKIEQNVDTVEGETNAASSQSILAADPSAAGSFYNGSTFVPDDAYNVENKARKVVWYLNQLPKGAWNETLRSAFVWATETLQILDRNNSTTGKEHGSEATSAIPSPGATATPSPVATATPSPLTSMRASPVTTALPSQQAATDIDDVEHVVEAKLFAIPTRIKGKKKSRNLACTSGGAAMQPIAACPPGSSSQIGLVTSTPKKSKKSSKPIPPKEYPILIMPTEYPYRLLSVPQMSDIACEILAAMDAVDYAHIPQFLYTRLCPGYLKLNCCNESTAHWLRRIMPRQTAGYVTIPLCAQEADRVEELLLWQAIFQLPFLMSNGEILDCIQTQNAKLRVACWHILQRLNNKTAAHLLIGTDSHGAAILNKLLGYIHFHGQSIKLRPVHSYDTEYWE